MFLGTGADMTDALFVRLQERGLPLERWGLPGTATKSYADFKREHDEGAVRITWSGELSCLRQGVCVEVIHTEASGRVFRLEEAHQEFPDGAIKKRNLPYVRETWESGETIQATAVRGVREELGIIASCGDFKLILPPRLGTPYVSETFPGLVTVRIDCVLRLAVSREDFLQRLNGWSFLEHRIISAFKWRLVNLMPPAH